MHMDTPDDPVELPPPAAPRYFLDQDNSCHWYMVQADKRAEWETWTGLSEEDEASWEPPEFAQRLDGGPARVTFAEPKEER